MPDGLLLTAHQDPDRDYLPISRAVHADFGWDHHRAHELAIFCSFAAPGIAAILDKTGEWARQGQKRYDDTVLLLREINRDGPASPRGRAAIRHLNRIHRPFGLANDDLRYVLATFVVVLPRWIERYGWRRLSDHEIRAIVRYYQVTGRLMGIRQIPATYQEFADYLDSYQRDHWSPTAEGRRLAESLINVIASWFPRPARPAVRRCITAALEPPLRQALGLPEPGGLTRAAVHAALRARAALLRRIPLLRHGRKRPRKLRSFPRGYELRNLGPSWAAGKDSGQPLRAHLDHPGGRRDPARRTGRAGRSFGAPADGQLGRAGGPADTVGRHAARASVGASSEDLDEAHNHH